jgi:hypothetical protein
MSDWWIDYPWRLIQTNLREIDMIDIDAERYVADLREFGATVAMINTAGIIASYPTELPYHYQSPFLQGSSLEEIIAACHGAEIRVIARTDFSKVRRPIYEMHPEWAYLTPEGHIVDYHGDVHVCVNSAYQQDYALRIIEEAITTLDVDGIFFNMGGYQVRDYSAVYHGICHCRDCRDRFNEMYGLPLPDAEDLHDPVYRKYALFKRRTLREHHEKVYNLIQTLRPDICIANHREFRRGFIRQESNTALDRPLPHWQYSGSENTRWAVASYPEMVCSNTSVDFIDFPVRHVAVSPHQQRLRLAQALANGGAPDYYIIGRLDNHEDRSGFEGVKEMFHFHAAHEADYAGMRPVAQVALINGPDADQAEFRGWFRFLVEGHYLFDVLMTEATANVDWSKYQVVILPDYRYISDELAAALDGFAERGGTVIATGMAGFADDEYESRPRPALNCLGIDSVDIVRTDMRGSYFRISPEDRAVLPYPRESDLVYLDGEYVYARYAEGAQPRLQLIPPHPFGPPERCYYTTVTDRPGVIYHVWGRGSGIYLPWRPGALFHRQGYVNTRDLIYGILREIPTLQPVRGNLPPMVEVTLLRRERDGHRLLHLVNTSGHFGVSFYEPVPMTDLVVQLPCADVPSAVTALVGEESLEFTVSDGTLTIRLPRLEQFEAIRITP